MRLSLTRAEKSALKGRFEAKVSQAPDSNCRLFNSGGNGRGYGQTSLGHEKILAHRAAYMLYVGPIPSGYDINHIRENGCTYRNCVNWEEHLEPVTRSENLRRMRAQFTTCPGGHSRTPEHGYVSSRNKWVCRTCSKTRWKRSNANPK